MDDGVGRIFSWCLAIGFICSWIGGCQSLTGHNYAVAAQHEKTAVGRVTKITYGRHGSVAYHYVFAVNGVGFDDTSSVCLTPLAPGACDQNGPVLVYYAYEPFQNSRLEDFAAASKHAYGNAKLALGVGLPLFIIGFIYIANSLRKGKSEDEPDPDEQKGASKSDAIPDNIHIVPDE
jgi:hypothetical protein